MIKILSDTSTDFYATKSDSSLDHLHSQFRWDKYVTDDTKLYLILQNRFPDNNIPLYLKNITISLPVNGTPLPLIFDFEKCILFRAK